MSIYRDGNVEKIVDYNSLGENITTEKSDGAKTIYTTKYASGKTKSSYPIECGVYHGRLSQYFPNGKILYDYDWLNGRKHGPYQYLTTDNSLEWGGQFDTGNEFGIWTDKNSIGRLESQGKFFNGQYDSIWNYYYVSGKISSNVAYKNGDRDGVASFFAPDGTPLLQKFFESGFLTFYRILTNGQSGEWIPVKKDYTIAASYPDGTKAYEEPIKNGLVNGPKRIFYRDGTIYSEQHFVDGNYNGKYVINHANGKPAESGQYKSDNLVGVRQFFNEAGTLIKSEEYVNGVRHGKTITYSNGVIQNEVLFWGGSPEK